MEHVGQVMVKSVKKRRFSENVGQVTVKSGDRQVIVTSVRNSAMLVTRGSHEGISRV